jgi:hypothetical protein
MTQAPFPFDDDDDDDKEPYFQLPTSRPSDPETSHDAARDATFHASKSRLLALYCLAKHGPCTDYELEAFTGRQKNSIGKRRLDCQRAGLVEVLVVDGIKQRRPGPSGSDCLVWQLTSKGRKFYAPGKPQ